jgi:hypothetical protein
MMALLAILGVAYLLFVLVEEIHHLLDEES